MATQAAVMSAKPTQVRFGLTTRSPATRFRLRFIITRFSRNAVEKALQHGGFVR